MSDTFALHYIPESFSVAGQKLMGLQQAGIGLLQAIARHGGLRDIGCFAADRQHADAFEAILRGGGFGGEVAWVPPSAPQSLGRFGCLYHPGPGIERLAWRRLTAGERRYSLCGITHATASHEMMSMVTGLLVAPVRGWDAIICTSRVVRDSLRVLVEEQADSFDMYCGHASQAVAVDGALLAQAYGRLVRDAELRRRMGEQARRRAESEFDWTVILGRYRALWDELAERQRADPVLAPPLPSRAPDRPDPFRLFASNATRPITAASLVELAPDASLAPRQNVRSQKQRALSRVPRCPSMCNWCSPTAPR